MTQYFKKKLCDAGCTLHGTGECGYDTRGIEQNCPYFNYILSGYELMERELLALLKECKENPVITDLQRGNIQELIEKIESL